MSGGAANNQTATAAARAQALYRAGRHEEALAASDAALAQTPDSPDLHNLRGQILAAQRRFGPAADAFRQAVALKPEFARAHMNLGLALKRHRQPAAAADALETAIRHGLDDEVIREKLGICQLKIGRFEEGWRNYEQRTDQNNDYSAVTAGKPEWTGEQDIRGKTVLVLSELGLGDTVLFSRYVRLLEAAGARVLFAPQKPLRALMRSMAGNFEIVDAHAAPAFDYYVRLMSLPKAFRTDMASIPAPSWLTADPARVKHFRQMMGPEGFKIGVCWFGRPRPAIRRFPAAMLEGISHIPGVRLISVQRGEGAKQLAGLPPGMTIETLGEGPEENDEALANVAAIITACDLVISCDTAMAHIAGALGRPVWIGLAFGSCWRWFTERRDSPWYPTARLFRQKALDDWSGVFEDMELELRTMLAAP